MKAVILVGGKATRLLPITSNTPKAMVPVLNTPFLEHVICHLRRHSITEIILSIGNLAGPIQSYFGDGSRLGVEISYAIENTPLGTAGGLKNAAGSLDEAIVALNGDVFTDLDITALIDFHRREKARATIALTRVDDPTHYGVIVTDAGGRVSCFQEKPAPGEARSNMINAGTYILEPEVLAAVPSGTQFSIEREVFPVLLDQGLPVYAYSNSAYWLDIGTHEKYLQVHYDLLNGKCRQYVLDLKSEVTIGAGSTVHPSARITGPVLIGDNCSIGPGVTLVGPSVIGSGCSLLENSVVEKSVIWPDIRIGPRASVKNSILADGCYLNADSIVEESVLGCNVTVRGGCRIVPGSRILAGTTF